MYSPLLVDEKKLRWVGGCTDDSKHSWTRQSITWICSWCGGEATASGAGVHSGSVMFFFLYLKILYLSQPMNNESIFSVYIFIHMRLVRQTEPLFVRSIENASSEIRMTCAQWEAYAMTVVGCFSSQMSHCLLKFMWSLAAGWHEREWQPGIFAFKSMGVWYRSDSYGGFTQWFPGKMDNIFTGRALLQLGNSLVFSFFLGFVGWASIWVAESSSCDCWSCDRRNSVLS